MLLDKYVLTKGLTKLMSYSPTAQSERATTAFQKRVTDIMARLDPLLKTLQVRHSPAEALVQAYLIHIGDRSDTNFRKILDLKGVRKMDQASLVELFGIHRDGKSNASLVQQSPLLTPLMNATGMGSTGLGITGAASGPIPTKFDAAAFGEKLFSAARDGVNSMGNVGTAGAPMGSPLADDAKAAVEGNLKSIGNFFKRDLSTFGPLNLNMGGRFARGSGHDEGTRQ